MTTKDCADFTGADLDRMFAADDIRLAAEIRCDLAHRTRLGEIEPVASREEAFWLCIPIVEDHCGEANTDYTYAMARRVSYGWRRTGW